MCVQSHVAVSSSYVGGPTDGGPQTFQSDIVIIIIIFGMGKEGVGLKAMRLRSKLNGKTLSNYCAYRIL